MLFFGECKYTGRKKNIYNLRNFTSKRKANKSRHYLDIILKKLARDT